MKIVFIFLTALLSFAGALEAKCPDLAGSYENGSSILKIEQMIENGVMVYTINDIDKESGLSYNLTWIADGKWHVDAINEEWSNEEKFKCSNGRLRYQYFFVNNSQGERFVYSKQLVVTYLDKNKNLIGEVRNTNQDGKVTEARTVNYRLPSN